jgi:uncharacterized protein with HEPN domain
MSRRDPGIYLRHMLDHAQEAIAMARGRERADLDTDRQFNLALVRLVEIIGEAANRVPEAERAHMGQVPWSQIVGLRNRLIHGYDEVDFNILWQIVTKDLPGLIKSLETILSSGS